MCHGGARGALRAAQPEGLDKHTHLRAASRPASHAGLPPPPHPLRPRTPSAAGEVALEGGKTRGPGSEEGKSRARTFRVAHTAAAKGLRGAAPGSCSAHAVQCGTARKERWTHASAPLVEAHKQACDAGSSARCSSEACTSDTCTCRSRLRRRLRKRAPGACEGGTHYGQRRRGEAGCATLFAETLSQGRCVIYIPVKLEQHVLVWRTAVWHCRMRHSCHTLGNSLLVLTQRRNSHAGAARTVCTQGEPIGSASSTHAATCCVCALGREQPDHHHVVACPRAGPATCIVEPQSGLPSNTEVVHNPRSSDGAHAASCCTQKSDHVPDWRSFLRCQASIPCGHQ